MSGNEPRQKYQNLAQEFFTQFIQCQRNVLIYSCTHDRLYYRLYFRQLKRAFQCFFLVTLHAPIRNFYQKLPTHKLRLLLSYGYIHNYLPTNLA